MPCRQHRLVEAAVGGQSTRSTLKWQYRETSSSKQSYQVKNSLKKQVISKLPWAILIETNSKAFVIKVPGNLHKEDFRRLPYFYKKL